RASRSQEQQALALGLGNLDTSSLEGVLQSKFDLTVDNCCMAGVARHQFFPCNLCQLLSARIGSTNRYLCGIVLPLGWSDSGGNFQYAELARTFRFAVVHTCFR